jgi:hypothetical protein
MQRIYRWLLLCVAAWSGVGCQAQAPYFSTAPAHHPVDSTWELEVDKTTITRGDVLTASFKVADEGIVRLWIHQRDGQGQLVSRASARPLMPVRARQRYTYTVNDLADEPAGVYELCLVWTSLPEQQPAHSPCDVPRAKRTPQGPYPVGLMQLLWMGYTLVHDPMAICPRAEHHRLSYTQGRVFVVAVSANTRGLLMTHVDAWHFTCVLQSLFDLPDAQVFYKSDATKDDLKALLGRARTLMQPGDLLILFISGHGSTVPDDDGDEAGQDPTDTEDEIIILHYPPALKDNVDSRYYIRDDELAQWVRDFESQQVMLVLDTCFSGGASMGSAITAEPPRSKFFRQGHTKARACEPSTTSKDVWRSMAGAHDHMAHALLLAAARECEEAFELPLRGGLFTAELVAQLRAPQSPDVLSVFYDTQQRVQHRADVLQHPVAVGNLTLAKALRFSQRR